MQELLSMLKSDGLAPPRAALVIMSAVVPVLVKVTGWEVVVTPAVEGGKARLGERLAMGAVTIAVVPVPMSATV